MANLQETTFGNLILPSGSTAQRPGVPAAGMMRYNTDMNLLEFYNDGWRPVTGVSKGTVGTGGNTIRYVGAGGNRTSGYITHMFTATGAHTFTPTFTGTVEVLLLAGGGSGGSHWGGGGGGGGMVFSRAFPVSAGTGVNITVGAGADRPSFPAAGNNGGNTTVGGLTAIGGGAGGSWSGDQSRQNGGSGGGGPNGDGESSRQRYLGGLGTNGQGFPGGSGLRFNAETDNTHQSGAGGGAGGPGLSGQERAYDGLRSDGGPGAANDIVGEILYWGGGGAAGAHLGNGLRPGAGGIGGGGGSAFNHGAPRGPTTQQLGIGGGQALNNGGASLSIQESGNGGTNTGGGGGGSNYQYSGLGAAGGSGVVIVRY